jgi:Zn ribbon nucleic-acid-binding protein
MSIPDCETRLHSFFGNRCPQCRDPSEILRHVAIEMPEPGTAPGRYLLEGEKWWWPDSITVVYRCERCGYECRAKEQP